MGLPGGAGGVASAELMRPTGQLLGQALPADQPFLSPHAGSAQMATGLSVGSWPLGSSSSWGAGGFTEGTCR